MPSRTKVAVFNIFPPFPFFRCIYWAPAMYQIIKMDKVIMNSPFFLLDSLTWLPPQTGQLLTTALEGPASLGCSEGSSVLCIESETLPWYLLSLIPVCGSALYPVYYECCLPGLSAPWVPFKYLKKVMEPLWVMLLIFIIVWSKLWIIVEGRETPSRVQQWAFV